MASVRITSTHIIAIEARRMEKTGSIVIGETQTIPGGIMLHMVKMVIIDVVIAPTMKRPKTAKIVIIPTAIGPTKK